MATGTGAKSGFWNKMPESIAELKCAEKRGMLVFVRDDDGVRTIEIGYLFGDNVYSTVTRSPIKPVLYGVIKCA